MLHAVSTRSAVSQLHSLTPQVHLCNERAHDVMDLIGDQCGVHDSADYQLPSLVSHSLGGMLVLVLIPKLYAEPPPQVQWVGGGRDCFHFHSDRGVGGPPPP